MWAGPRGCNWPACWQRLWIPAQSYVVHFSEEALMRKRLELGAESLEFPVVPWGLIVVGNYPGQHQGEVACLSSRPHTAPGRLRLPGPMRELESAPAGGTNVLGAVRCQRGRSFSLCSAVASTVPGARWVLSACSFP